ncbi:unnamed protein product, partial [Thlaspi arvense]
DIEPARQRFHGSCEKASALFHGIETGAESLKKEIAVMEEELKTKEELIKKHTKLIQETQKLVKQQIEKHRVELEKV